MNINIKKYQDNDELIWDEFVNKECFGTIYHTRKFINYHPKDRFEDHSILIYDKEILICILPCCKRGEKYFSYTGATYGGPVFHYKYVSIKHMKIIIDKIFNYFNNQIEFRLANPIYFDESISKLYYLLSTKLKMIPELSWYINTDTNFLNNIKNKDNKRLIKKIISDSNIRCYCTKNENDYIEFHDILSINLNTNHTTSPTHTKNEFLLLKKNLDDKQLLFIVKNIENIILGGVYLIKATNQCWYIMYMSKNILFKQPNVSIMYIILTIINEAKKENVKYIDYGICTENQGLYLNIGLAEYKEDSLGGTSCSRYLFIQY